MHRSGRAVKRFVENVRWLFRTFAPLAALTSVLVIDLSATSCTKSDKIAFHSDTSAGTVHTSSASATSVQLSPAHAEAAKQNPTQTSPPKTVSATTRYQEDLHTCYTHTRPDSIDSQIAACTRLINARRLSREELVRAYLNRGFAYNELYGDREHNHFSQAITDLREAIRLKPNSADAFFIHGRAYSYMGYYDRAIADVGRAIQLYPSGASIFRKGNAFNSRGIVYEFDGKGHFRRARSQITAKLSV